MSSQEGFDKRIPCNVNLSLYYTTGFPLNSLWVMTLRNDWPYRARLWHKSTNKIKIILKIHRYSAKNNLVKIRRSGSVASTWLGNNAQDTDAATNPISSCHPEIGYEQDLGVRRVGRSQGKNLFLYKWFFRPKGLKTKFIVQKRFFPWLTSSKPEASF